MPRESLPPQATVRRLSLYLRCLDKLSEKGIQMVSSQQLAMLLDQNSAQIRKDLAYFGEFGKRGVGYSVDQLQKHLLDILGLKKQRSVGIVGAGGRLGHALALYKGFEKRNFKVVALFDKDTNVISEVVGSAGPIHHISEIPALVKKLKIEMLILTVPAEAIHELFDYIFLSGVKAVLNFAPVKLNSTETVRVHNVDLTVELEYLNYYLLRKGTGGIINEP